ncbi:MAG: family 2 glycosyl transferase [Mucilaginibacter sp.]|nr:family 2 glycosyl transferase [Mucilaginibacter sp.]
MATYNGERYISEQIKSILTQLPIDAEFIISDDGSTDETISIITAFNDNRIKLFANNSGFHGPVGNFSNALLHSKGEYIFLADQDDLWIEGKLQKHMQLMQQYELVISDAIVIDENNEILFESYFKARRSRTGLIKNLLVNSFLGCCMSFRRDLLNRAMPFPTYIHMHDWWIGLVAELKGNIFFCDDKFLFYRRHSANASPTLIHKLPFFQQLTNRLGFVIALLLRKINK